jgi:hypothetical protein
MLAKRRNFFKRCGFAAATVAFIGASATAQENADQAADEDDVIDEIVVIAGGKSGDPVDVEALYEDMMRERLMLERDRLRVLEEENEWRSSASTAVKNPSRIKWGYDPQDELRMRRESNLSDVQWITTKPATVFRVEF